jgi:hypothetical protein
MHVSGLAHRKRDEAHVEAALLVLTGVWAQAFPHAYSGRKGQAESPALIDQD